MPRSPASRKVRNYAGQTPAEREADRRERLIAAALKLFGSQGYHQTPIEQLCAEARVTARHFYEAFGDRERLFRAVYDRVIAECAQAVIRGLSTASNPSDRLRAGVRAYVEFMQKDTRRARIQCLESGAVGVGFAAHRRDVFHSFAALMAREAEGLVGQRFPDLDLRLATIALAAAADSLIVEHVLDPGGAPADEVVRILTHLFEGAAQLVPAPAAER